MNERFTRRGFLRRLSVIGTGTFLLPVASHDANAAPAGFVPVGRASNFAPGAYRAVVLPGGAVVQLCRLPGRVARFQALSAHCTHKGCLVSWVPHDKQFHCPCHGGRFDANGRNIAGPPPAPLPALRTKVVRGIVLVSL